MLSLCFLQLRLTNSLRILGRRQVYLASIHSDKDWIIPFKNVAHRVVKRYSILHYNTAISIWIFNPLFEDLSISIPFYIPVHVPQEILLSTMLAARSFVLTTRREEQNFSLRSKNYARNTRRYPGCFIRSSWHLNAEHQFVIGGIMWIVEEYQIQYFQS